jgi:hypothetical protein
VRVEVVAGALMVALSGEPAVAATPGRAVGRLVVSGSEPACPRAEEIVSGVNRLLGRSAIADDGDDLRVYWRVEPIARGTVSVFRLVARDGTELGVRAVRSEGPDCQARRDADVLTLALMLDVPGTPEPPARSGPPLALALGSTAALGWFPEPRLGVDGQLSMALGRRFAPGLGFTWWPASAYFAGSNHYQMSAWLLSLSGSLALWESPLGRAGLRAGVRAGGVRAAGLGLAVNTSSSQGVADLTAAAEASVRLLGPLSLAAAAGVATPLRRPEVTFQDAERRTVAAHRAGRVSGLVTIAAVVHFVP